MRIGEIELDKRIELTPHEKLLLQARLRLDKIVDILRNGDAADSMHSDVRYTEALTRYAAAIAAWSSKEIQVIKTQIASEIENRLKSTSPYPENDFLTSIVKQVSKTYRGAEGFHQEVLDSITDKFVRHMCNPKTPISPALLTPTKKNDYPKDLSDEALADFLQNNVNKKYGIRHIPFGHPTSGLGIIVFCRKNSAAKSQLIEIGITSGSNPLPFATISRSLDKSSKKTLKDTYVEINLEDVTTTSAQQAVAFEYLSQLLENRKFNIEISRLLREQISSYSWWGRCSHPQNYQDHQIRYEKSVKQTGSANDLKIESAPVSSSAETDSLQEELNLTQQKINALISQCATNENPKGILKDLYTQRQEADSLTHLQSKVKDIGMAKNKDEASELYQQFLETADTSNPKKFNKIIHSLQKAYEELVDSLVVDEPSKADKEAALKELTTLQDNIAQFTLTILEYTKTGSDDATGDENVTTVDCLSQSFDDLQKQYKAFVEKHSHGEHGLTESDLKPLEDAFNKAEILYKQRVQTVVHCPDASTDVFIDTTFGPAFDHTLEFHQKKCSDFKQPKEQYQPLNIFADAQTIQFFQRLVSRNPRLLGAQVRVRKKPGQEDFKYIQLPNRAEDFNAYHLRLLSETQHYNVDGREQARYYNKIIEDIDIGTLRQLYLKTTETSVETLLFTEGYKSPFQAVEKHERAPRIIIDYAERQFQLGDTPTGAACIYAKEGSALDNYAKKAYVAEFGRQRPLAHEVQPYLVKRTWNGRECLVNTRAFAQLHTNSFLRVLASQRATLFALCKNDSSKRVPKKAPIKFLKAGMGFFKSKLTDSNLLEIYRLEGILKGLQFISSLDHVEQQRYIGSLNTLILPFSASFDKKSSAGEKNKLRQLLSLIENQARGLSLKFSTEGKALAVDDEAYTAITTCGDPFAQRGNEGLKSYINDKGEQFEALSVDPSIAAGTTAYRQNITLVKSYRCITLPNQSNQLPTQFDKPKKSEDKDLDPGLVTKLKEASSTVSPNYSTIRNIESADPQLLEQANESPIAKAIVEAITEKLLPKQDKTQSAEQKPVEVTTAEAKSDTNFSDTFVPAITYAYGNPAIQITRPNGDIWTRMLLPSGKLSHVLHDGLYYRALNDQFEKNVQRLGISFVMTLNSSLEQVGTGVAPKSLAISRQLCLLASIYRCLGHNSEENSDKMLYVLNQISIIAQQDEKTTSRNQLKLACIDNHGKPLRKLKDIQQDVLISKIDKTISQGMSDNTISTETFKSILVASIASITSIQANKQQKASTSPVSVAATEDHPYAEEIKQAIGGEIGKGLYDDYIDIIRQDAIALLSGKQTPTAGGQVVFAIPSAGGKQHGTLDQNQKDIKSHEKAIVVSCLTEPYKTNNTANAKAYLDRLLKLKQANANIAFAAIFSANSKHRKTQQEYNKLGSFSFSMIRKDDSGQANFWREVRDLLKNPPYKELKSILTLVAVPTVTRLSDGRNDSLKTTDALAATDGIRTVQLQHKQIDPKLSLQKSAGSQVAKAKVGIFHPDTRGKSTMHTSTASKTSATTGKSTMPTSTDPKPSATGESTMHV